MGESSKNLPPGHGTRGGSSMDPLDMLEERSRDNRKRITELEHWKIQTGATLDQLVKNTKKMVDWLDGNGNDGFKSEWAVTKERMSSAERWKWVAVGVLASAMTGVALAFLGALVRDLATRGAL